MAVPNSPRTVRLAASVLETVSKLEEHLEQNGLPSCSFEPRAPVRLPLPPRMNERIDEAISSLQELSALLLGPMGWMVQHIGQAVRSSPFRVVQTPKKTKTSLTSRKYDMVGMQAMYRYKIPLQFPVGDTIAVTELARRCDVDEEVLARIVQHAVTKRFLAQPQPGYVAHTAFSSMLADAPPLIEWVGLVSEDLWPAATRIIQALTKWPGGPWLPNQTGHNLADGTSVTFFETLENDPARSQRFSISMSVMQSFPGWEPTAALEVYDWGALDANAVVVDVGGGDGTFALALNKRHPKLKHIIVQDVAAIIDRATSSRSQREHDAISFQTHDFFLTQPVRHADVYFLRKILHDWPDEYAVKILQQLVPAMKSGARILINDHCMPPPGTTSMHGEWMARGQDLAMMALFNSKERTASQWKDLIASADPRFSLKSVTPMPPGPLALMEVIWE